MTAIDFNDTFAYTSSGPQDNGPTMQWATGLQATNRQIITGWLIPTVQDDDLDMALLAKDTPQTTITHSSGKTVTHWHLERAELLLVATDISGPNGIWFAWQTLEDGRSQSKLKCRVYVRALVEAGYRHSLLVSMKSTQTTDLKKALGFLYDMSTATKKPIPIYAWWLPTMPGDDVARGKTQKKSITPVIADVPSEPSREWLVEHYAARDKALLSKVESELPAVITWSAEATEESADLPAEPASEKQRNYIAILQDKLAWHSDQLVAYAQEQGVDLVMLTTKQASEFIDGLQRLVDERSAQPVAPVDDMKPAEAERRFYNAYGKAIADHLRCTPADVGWKEVCLYIGWPSDEPIPLTADEWRGVARAIKSMQKVAA